MSLRPAPRSDCPRTPRPAPYAHGSPRRHLDPTHHLGRRRDPLIVDHARYWALGNTPFEREGAFRGFMDEGVSAREAQAISTATRRGWPIAGQEARARLSAQLGCDIAPRPRGRPRRAEKSAA